MQSESNGVHFTFYKSLDKPVTQYLTSIRYLIIFTISLCRASCQFHRQVGSPFAVSVIRQSRHASQRHRCLWRKRLCLLTARSFTTHLHALRLVLRCLLLLPCFFPLPAPRPLGFVGGYLSLSGAAAVLLQVVRGSTPSLSALSFSPLLNFAPFGRWTLA